MRGMTQGRDASETRDCGEDGGAFVSPRARWALALLFAVYALNLFDRQIINVLAEAIKRDLEISDAQLGLLTGAAFGIFYSVLGIPFGRLADRINRPKLISGAVLFWSLFTAASGMAGNFMQLFATRVGVGIGEAGSQPASTSLLYEIVPKKRRATAMSIMLLGAPVGSFLGLTIGGLAASWFGWRIAFMLAAVPGLILGLLVWITIPDPRTVRAASRPPALSGALRMMGSSRAFRWLTVSLTCSVLLVYGSGAWVPAFLIRMHGMPTPTVGMFSGLAVGIGGGIGALGGGFLVDKIRPHRRQPEMLILISAMALSVPFLLCLVFAPSPPLALVALFMFNVVAFAYLGPLMTLIQLQVAPESRGLAIGLVSSIANIVSLGIGLPAIGLLSDILAPSYGVQSIGMALAISLVFVAILGVLANSRALLAGPKG